MTTATINLIPTMDEAQRSQLRYNSERWLTNGTEAQKANARTVLAALDGREYKERAELQERIAGWSPVERVANAFKTMPLSKTERDLLQVVLDNPGATSEQLDSAMGWKGGWHLHFGGLCRDREHLLWLAQPAIVRDGDFYCGILTHFSERTRGYTMKPEVAEGLTMIGMCATPNPKT